MLTFSRYAAKLNHLKTFYKGSKSVENKEIRDNRLYFDISKQERDSAIRYLLSSIIKSRKDTNFPSNSITFDEDVNVYLAHLLFAVSLPEYHEMAEPYLSLETSDILKWVKNTEDRTIRYFIFKVNADHIMIHTAIFDDLLQRHKHHFFKRSAKHYKELAQLYYDQAAIYHNRIYRKKTGVGEVLEKLSNYYDSYQGLLKHVRREYFNFVNGFRDQAFNQFMDQVRGYEHESKSKSKMDQFLDLYGRWLQTKDPSLEPHIYMLSRDLHALDPEFHFDYDREIGGRHNERKCA
jgi:hypothetical protein